MKRFLSLINLRDLVTNTCLMVIGLALIACGGPAGMVPTVIGGTARAVVHLIHLPASGHRIAPTTTSKPFLAALFQTSTPTPSQLAQSYDIQCTLFTVGLVVPVGDLMPIPGTPENAQNGGTQACNNEVPTPLPQIDGQGGKATFFDGTLTSLVVTGKTLSGVSFQCRDISHTFPVLDNSITQTYLDPNSHQVKIFNQTVPNGSINQAPFVCTGIGTDTDPVNTIEVQFAKI
jgi:hypothetical protein